MPTKSPPQKTSPTFIDIDESNVRDLKFCVASFFAIILVLFHYAWIMRQWVLNPNLPRSTLFFYSFTLVCTVVVVFGVLAKVVHPKIYSSIEKTATEEKKNN